jgi:hypothetical protein
MLFKGCDQGRQTTGGYTGGCCCGTQGPHVEAPVQAFDQSDLGVTEPIQDDPTVRGQAQLNRSGTVSQRLNVVLETGSAVDLFLQRRCRLEEPVSLGADLTPSTAAE